MSYFTRWSLWFRRLGCLRSFVLTTRSQAIDGSPVGLEIMLRTYFVQHWLILADPYERRCKTRPQSAA